MEPHSYFIFLGSKYCPQHPAINIFNLCSFLSTRHQVSNSYKIIVKIIILNILIFMFLDSKQKNRRIWTTQQKPFPTSDLLITLQMQFWFVIVLPKYMNYATLPKDIFSTYFYFTIMSCNLVIRHNICLVFSAFTCRPTFFQASNRPVLFSFTVYVLTQ